MVKCFMHACTLAVRMPLALRNNVIYKAQTSGPEPYTTPFLSFQFTIIWGISGLGFKTPHFGRIIHSVVSLFLNLKLALHWP